MIHLTSSPPQLGTLQVDQRIVGSVVNMNKALNGYTPARDVIWWDIQRRLVWNLLITLSLRQVLSLQLVVRDVRRGSVGNTFIKHNCIYSIRHMKETKAHFTP